MKKWIAVFLFFVSVSPAFAESPSGVITSVDGEVSVLRRGSYIPAVPGMQVRKNDVVRSGSGSLDVSLNQLAGVRILPSSEVSVSETAKEDMRVNVKSGNVILNLRKLPRDSKFRVETPTAVASVRGTQFWGRVDKTAGDTTTFAVREGAVDVLAKGARRTFRLKPGDALDIPAPGGERPKKRAALEDEMSAMQQADTVETS